MIGYHRMQQLKNRDVNGWWKQKNVNLTIKHAD